MTDRLTSLLRQYADDMNAGHQAPPAPASRRRRGHSSKTRVVLPALAAASVVAVVLGTAVVLQPDDATEGRITTVAGQPEPPRPGDAAPPPPVILPRVGNDNSYEPAPADRERLTVELELPDTAYVDVFTPYTVRISNPSNSPISMKPCPAYRFEHGGQATIGRLPCEKLPENIAPGQELRIELQAQFGYWDGPDAPARPNAPVAWGIGGPAAARGQLTLAHPALPAPLTTAPFVGTAAPPGEPLSGQQGLALGMRPAWPLLPGIVQAPTSVRAGQTLRYTVRLFNDDPQAAFPLRPCRGFTQWLQRPVRPAGEQVAFLDWSFEREEITSLEAQEHMLNCAALPEELPSRQLVHLRMELQVPKDYPAGPASLAWKVGELDVFGSPQTRYVTVNVLTPAS